MAQELAEDGRPVKYLAQGTIYPDIIESGARKTGGKASTIKSHHNLIPFPEGVHFDLIEPLDHFFKDEVRALGTALGLPDHIVHRQPFPGPGLAIRVIGAATRDKLAILKEADAIVREELDAYNERLFEACGRRDGELAREAAGGPEIERPVWQYFAVLPDVKSVGVMGDERTYPARRGELRRDDGGLGEAALRRAGPRVEPHRGRGARREPRGVRHHEQAAGDDRVGVIRESERFATLRSEKRRNRR